MKARFTILAIAIGLMFSGNAMARMYKWNSPQTGTTEFAGKPPAWYRTGGKGPRVYVFENGQLIDDTSVAVSESRRRELRREAIQLAMPDRAPSQSDASLRAALASPVRSEPIDAQTPVPEFEADLAELLGSTSGMVDKEPELSAEGQEETPEDTIDRLKGILDAWDQSRTRRARAVLE